MRLTASGSTLTAGAAALLLALSGCSPAATPAPGPDAVPVAVATVVQKAIPVQIQAIGRVEAYSTVDVKSQVGGILTGVHFEEGQDVRKGDLLFTIDKRSYQASLDQAEAALARDRIQLATARENAERYTDLVKKEYVTREEYDRIKSQADALDAVVKADEAAVENARLQVGYCTITSPIAGRTGKLMVHQGNLVKANADTPMVTINQVEPIYVAFSVPEDDLPEIRRHASSGTLVAEAHPAGNAGSAESGKLHIHRQCRGSQHGDHRAEGYLHKRGPRAVAGAVHRCEPHPLRCSPTRSWSPPRRCRPARRDSFVFVVGEGHDRGVAPRQPGQERRRSDRDRERSERGRDRGHRRAAPAHARSQGRGEVRGRIVNIAGGFIRRPVMTTIVMVGILLFGVMAYRLLPVSDLPNVDFPTIQVSASLPGASPETMASAVATPLERQFSTIAGLDSMSSASALGSTQITLQFDLSRELDAAAQDVQAAIAKVTSQLPKDMPSPPTYQKVNPADQPILYLALTSPSLPLSTLDEYGETLMAQRISTVTGVAQVVVYGSQKYAVRIKLDPKALATRGIGLDEVTAAVQNANVNLPTGTLYGEHRSFTVEANGQLTAADQYLPVIVAYRDGAPVRIRDLGTAIDSVENDKTAAWFGNRKAIQRSIVLAIQRQPGTNTVEVSDRVKSLIPQLSRADAGVGHARGAVRPVRVDPRFGPGREVHASADALPGHPGHLPVPEESLRHRDPQPRAADVDHRDLLGDVPAGIQPGQPLPDGTHPLGGVRRRRRDRHAGEHRPAHGDGRGAVPGGVVGARRRSASPSSP